MVIYELSAIISVVCGINNFKDVSYKIEKYDQVVFKDVFKTIYLNTHVMNRIFFIFY